MKWLVGLVALLVPVLTLADGHLPRDLPRLGNVVDVAQDDVLNIRQAPDARSDILATLAPNATDVEIIAQTPDQRWALVNTGEASGWVRSRFLQATSPAAWHGFAQPLSCFGTEPFWSFTLTQNAETAHFTGLDQPQISYQPEWRSGISGRTPFAIGLGAGDGDHGFAAVIEAAQQGQDLCSDGMSDRLYRLKLRLFVQIDGATQGYEGCCSIQPD